MKTKKIHIDYDYDARCMMVQVEWNPCQGIPKNKLLREGEGEGGLFKAEQVV